MSWIFCHGKILSLEHVDWKKSLLKNFKILQNTEVLKKTAQLWKCFGKCLGTLHKKREASILSSFGEDQKFLLIAANWDTSIHFNTPTILVQKDSQSLTHASSHSICLLTKILKWWLKESSIQLKIVEISMLISMRDQKVMKVVVVKSDLKSSIFNQIYKKINLLNKLIIIT